MIAMTAPTSKHKEIAVLGAGLCCASFVYLLLKLVDADMGNFQALSALQQPS